MVLAAAGAAPIAATAVNAVKAVVVNVHFMITSFLYVDLQVDGDNSHAMNSLSSRWFSSLLVSVWAWGSAESRAQTDTSLAFLCPIKVLQDAYTSLADPTEALSALAIERHVLAICRESQVKLLEIHENNQQLEELFRVRSGGVPRAVEVHWEGDSPQIAVATEEQPDFALRAIVRRTGGTRALILVDGVTRSVSPGDVLETGHEVVAIAGGVVRLVSPAGSTIVVD